MVRSRKFIHMGMMNSTTSDGAQLHVPVGHEQRRRVPQQQANGGAQEGHPQGVDQGVHVDGAPGTMCGGRLVPGPRRRIADSRMMWLLSQNVAEVIQRQGWPLPIGAERNRRSGSPGSSVNRIIHRNIGRGEQGALDARGCAARTGPAAPAKSTRPSAHQPRRPRPWQRCVVHPRSPPHLPASSFMGFIM